MKRPWPYTARTRTRQAPPTSERSCSPSSDMPPRSAPMPSAEPRSAYSEIPHSILYIDWCT
eukprot:9480947-Pyramimonas_sp.AAC.1